MQEFIRKQRNPNGIVLARDTEGYDIYVMFRASDMRDFIIKSSKLSGSKLEIMYNQDNNLVDYKHGIWRTISTPNTTITHYAPIEAGEDISSFKVGAPVFASGHVYKQVSCEWESSTINDRSDCICSVVINGTYKEFVGVITDVDISRRCITFATHGDFLFNVDDANIYQIGDVILFNGKILDEDYAMTLRIQQSIVGKVTAKINETTLAIFRS